MNLPTSHVPGRKYSPFEQKSQLFCSCGWNGRWFSDYEHFNGSGLGTEIRRAYEEHLLEKPYYGFLII